MHIGGTSISATPPGFSRQALQPSHAVPVSGLVVTFDAPITCHGETVDALRAIPEVEIGPSGGSKLALVVDSATKRRDQEVWDTVRDAPGVVDLAIALVAFEEPDACEEDDSQGGPIRTTTTPPA